jgi:hypothetical protein
MILSVSILLTFLFMSSFYNAHCPGVTRFTMQILLSVYIFHYGSVNSSINGSVSSFF